MRTTPWGRSAAILCALIAATTYAQVLTSVTVSGPTELTEGTGGLFTVRAYFSNGLNFDVTLFSELSVSPPEFGTIDQFGQFTAGQVDQDEIVLINAAFTWAGVTLQGSREVTLVDVSVYSCSAPSYLWGRAFGGGGADGARRVHIDGAGSVYVCGSFEQTVDFDPTAGVDQYTAAGVTDGFVTKFNSAGQYLWTRVFTGAGNAAAVSVDIAPDGAVYVAGTFDGSIDLDPGAAAVTKTTVGQQDFFVVKLTGSGAFLWGHGLGGTNPDDAFAIAVDHDGECVVAGSFQYTVDFDPGAGTVSRVAMGQRDIFALKLAGNGAFRWVYTAGNRQSDEALGVAVDAQRNVFIAGRFSTIVDFDPSPAQNVLQVLGVTDCFIVRLNADGLFQWVRGFGGPSTDGIRDIAVADNGDLLVGGYFWDTVDFNPGSGVDSMASAGQSDGFVSRFTNAGAYRWTSRVGGAFMDEVAAVATDAEDRVLAAGYFAGTVDFNDGGGVANATSRGAEDAFVIKYSTNSGTFQWVATFGSQQSDFVNSLSADDEGRIILGGSYRATIDLDPTAFDDPRVSFGASDCFVSALRCGAPPPVDPFACNSPTFIAALPVGGTGNDTADAVAVLSDGSRVIAGTFSGAADLNPTIGVDLRQAAGGTDVYITRYRADGSYAWSRTVGGLGNEWVSAVAISGEGDIYVCGTFAQTVDFNPGPGVFNATSVGLSDAFVLRLSQTGEFAWVRTVGGTLDDVAYGVAIDTYGNVVVAGAYEATADFDPTPASDQRISRGGPDIFVWSLSAAGEYRWAYTVGRSNIDEALAVTLDRNGRILVTGRFQAVVDFDPGPEVLALTSAGATDVFVLALTSDGFPVWARGIGGVSTESGRAIACSPNNDVTIAGHFWATCDFDPGPAVVAATSLGEGDAFIVRLTANGDLVWVRTAGGELNDEALGVSVDNSGNSTAVGEFHLDADFDREGTGYSLSSIGATDAFVWRILNSGQFGWAVAIGGASADDARGVDVDRTATVHTVGSFSGLGYLDPTGPAVTPSMGGSDAFATLLQCGFGLPDLCAGDLNCDGMVNFAEIDLFVFALQGQQVWEDAYPSCPWLNADCNGDMVVDFSDIDAFVARLGQVCGTAARFSSVPNVGEDPANGPKN